MIPSRIPASIPSTISSPTEQTKKETFDRRFRVSISRLSCVRWLIVSCIFNTARESNPSRSVKSPLDMAPRDRQTHSISCCSSFSSLAFTSGRSLAKPGKAAVQTVVSSSANTPVQLPSRGQRGDQGKLQSMLSRAAKPLTSQSSLISYQTEDVKRSTSLPPEVSTNRVSALKCRLPNVL